MSQVPKGEAFLIEYNTKFLEDLYKKEKNGKAKIRLQAAVLRKKNKTLEQISSIVGYPITTVGDWLRRLNNNGIERIYSIKQEGRPKKITKIQEEELKKILCMSPKKQGFPYSVWTTKILLYFIDQTYSVLYKLRNIEKLVKKLGFSIKKARPEHRKANKKLQEDFKKKFKKRFNQEFTMDLRSFVLTKFTSL